MHLDKYVPKKQKNRSKQRDKKVKEKLLSSNDPLPPEISKAFKILGLNKNATLLDIEKSFRKLAVMYHPDRCKEENKSKCREKFVEINNARKLLEDYFANKYKPLSKKEKQEIRKYKKYIKEYKEYIKRFYDDWFGGVDI